MRAPTLRERIGIWLEFEGGHAHVTCALCYAFVPVTLLIGLVWGESAMLWSAPALMLVTFGWMLSKGNGLGL